MSEGFFTRKEVESKTRPNGKTLSCTSCGLYKNAESPKMQPFGNFKKGIMNIGEAPTELDDKRNVYWAGKEGQLLKRTYRELGIDLFEDCININSVSCFPNDEGDYRIPSSFELENCRRFILAAIEKYKPKIIILFGNIPLYSLIAHRWKKDLGTINKWRGWNIPDQDFKCWICPTFNPKQVLYQSEKNEVIEVVWKNDLKKAIEYCNIPFMEYTTPEIDVIEDLEDLQYSPLGSVLIKNKPTLIAFDYETTGLKPHAEGHRIVCCSIAYSPDYVKVFMMPETRKKRKPFIDLLTDPDIKKIAQNLKFEHTWSKVRLGIEVENWVHDTMIATHILDNREGITGLKFQTYVQFGVIDYDSEISPYLKAVDDKNANALNRIMELVEMPGGKEKLMHYCALDSIFEYRLAMLQMSLINTT